MGFAAIPAALGGAGLLGLGIYEGEKQMKEQKRALRAQEEAQDQAERAAFSEARRAELRERAANRRQPDTTSLLTGSRRRARQGAASTLLTGTRGVADAQLTLGRSSLLGGGEG